MTPEDQSGLDVQVQLTHPEGYRRLLNQREVMSGLPTLFAVTATNIAKTPFAGGTLQLTVEEHGTSIGTGSLTFETTPHDLGQLKTGEVASHNYSFAATLPGLLEFVFTVTQGGTKVHLSGYRSTSRLELKLYFTVVDRQLLEIRKGLSQLDRTE